MNRYLAITLILLTAAISVLGTSCYRDYQVAEMRAFEMASDACTALDKVEGVPWEKCMRRMHYY
jgi:hypothetical protein